MAKYNLSVHAILKIFLERVFYICSFLYTVILLSINLKLLRKLVTI